MTYAARIREIFADFGLTEAQLIRMHHFAMLYTIPISKPKQEELAQAIWVKHPENAPSYHQAGIYRLIATLEAGSKLTLHDLLATRVVGRTTGFTESYRQASPTTRATMERHYPAQYRQHLRHEKLRERGEFQVRHQPCLLDRLQEIDDATAVGTWQEIQRQLKPVQAEVLEMCCFEQESLHAIAQTTNRSNSSTSNHYRRALELIYANEDLEAKLHTLLLGDEELGVVDTPV